MKYYDLVKILLTANPILRDSDKMLVYTIWYKRGFADLHHITKDAFLKAPDYNSISRARRHVQHDFPLLRSSNQVQKEKDLIEAQKGTHVYRQTLDNNL